MRILLLATLGLLGATRQAAAGERAVGLKVGWASATIPDARSSKQPPPTLASLAGSGVALQYDLGVSPDLTWRSAISSLGFFSGDGPSLVGIASTGILLRFDVLAYVPYAYAQLGALYRRGGVLPSQFEPVALLGGGLEVLHSRAYSWGLEVELAAYGSELATLSVGLRGAFHWGYF